MKKFTAAVAAVLFAVTLQAQEASPVYSGELKSFPLTGVQKMVGLNSVAYDPLTQGSNSTLEVQSVASGVPSSVSPYGPTAPSPAGWEQGSIATACRTVAVQFFTDGYFSRQRRTFEIQYREQAGTLIDHLGYIEVIPAATAEFHVVSRESRIRAEERALRQVRTSGADCALFLTLLQYDNETDSFTYRGRRFRSRTDWAQVQSFNNIRLIRLDGSGLTVRRGDGQGLHKESQDTSSTVRWPTIRIFGKKLDLGTTEVREKNDLRGRVTRESAIKALVDAFRDFAADGERVP